MKTVRLISFISRVFLMITLGLGLLYWIAQVPVLSRLLALLVQINYISIHEGFGFIGILGLLILGVVAVFTRGSRRLGAGSMIYALVVPAFGLSQPLLQVLTGGWFWLIQIAHLLVGIGAMMLALRIGKRYQQLKLKEQGATSVQPQGLIGRIAVLASNTTKEQGVTSAQPQGRPYPPLVARLARAAIAAHVALYRLSGGKVGGQAQHMPVLLLTTTGRKSGKPHTTALVYMPDGDDFVVVASNGGQAKLPNWWLNMRKSKQAQIEVGRKRLRVSVHEANGEERQRLWSRIIAYRAGHEAYQERTPYPLPLVILHPEEAL
jgi:F420H(2)-dependent quinone reductase